MKRNKEERREAKYVSIEIRPEDACPDKYAKIINVPPAAKSSSPSESELRTITSSSALSLALAALASAIAARAAEGGYFFWLVRVFIWQWGEKTKSELCN